MIVLDFEASSLNNGFPVSVGVAGADGRLYYRVVKPDPEWSVLSWDPVAEQIHGLSRDYIEANGKSPSGIMVELNEMFADEVLVSDNPSFEWRWLSLLEEFGGLAAFKLSSISVASILSDIAADTAVDAVNLATINRLRKASATHNALADAASWLAAAEVVSGWDASKGEIEILDIFGGWRQRVTDHLARLSG